MPPESPIRLSADTIDHSVLDTLAADGSQAIVGETLTAALKEQLVAALAESEQSEIVELIQALGSEDLRANKDTPLRVLLANQAQMIAGDNPDRRAAFEAALAGLSDQTTLGEILALDLPLRDHPLFRDAANKAALDAILATTPGLTDDGRSEFIDLYTNQAGPTSHFWQGLAQRPGFDDPATIKAIQTTLQLGRLTHNNPGLVRAIRAQTPVESLRDLIRLDRADWRDLIRQGVEAGTIPLPASVPGDTVADKIERYVDSIVEQLTTAFPTAYVAKSIGKGPQIDRGVLQALLRRNPDVDLLAQPEAVDWGDMPAEDQARALAALQELRREARMFPGFDYRAALVSDQAPGARAISAVDDQSSDGVVASGRQAVAQFFANAPDFDFRTTHIDSFVAEQAETAFRDIDAPEHVTTQLKRMQRVFQVTPSYETMSVLMGEGLDSAHKITSMPQHTFVQQFADHMGGVTAAQSVYARAEFVTAATAQLYTQISQALTDVQPHALGATVPDIKEYPNLATLFGQANLCDCKDCRSVYSPAAYLVDLLHRLLRTPNSSNDVSPTPLRVLLDRRPDLEYIRLTCENTNTALPYVDLVNEILESYVVLGKLDQTVAKDTGDSTTDELNAEPHYTNSAAYDRLKQAVFPMSLPFDQPITVARAYLEQLGSSRHALMETFERNGAPSALDRAGEYLLLSPAERAIILDQVNVPTSTFYGYTTWSPPSETIWVEDALPTGATAHVENDAWTWITSNPTPLSGTKAHQSNLAAGMHQHFFMNAAPGMPIAVDDYLFAYVYLDPANPPREIVLQWNDGTWEHRAYWGANLINWGVTGTNSRRFMGALPPVGQWVRLEVPAKDVGLEGKTITGMAFSLFDGRATWDRAGKRGALASVPVFLRRTNLQFTDLIALLDTRFINPGRAMTLDAPASADPCSLDQTMIKGLDEATLRKMQRFIRLWRKLDMTMPELDTVLTALQATNISGDTLQQIAQIKQLQATLRLPLVQIASLWAPIDTRGTDSLYKTVFLNRAVLNPSDPNDLGNVFLPRSDGSVLTDATKTISGHVAPLLAAFRLSAADLALIRADARLDADNTPLNLANVSALYRYGLLARALKLSVKDLIALKLLVGATMSPFSAPAATMQFVQLAQTVQQSGFSVAQLSYLYRHVFDPKANIAPSHDSVLLLVRSLRDGLTRIAASYALADDPMGELLRTRLGELFESATVDRMIRTLDGSASYTAAFNSSAAITFPDDLAGRIVYDPDVRVLRLTGALSTADRDNLLTKVLPATLRTNPDYQAAIAQLFQQPRSFIADTAATFLNVPDAIAKLLDNQPQPLTTEAKFQYVLQALSAYLQADRSYTLVRQTLSDALRLDLPTMELLLRRFNNQQGIGNSLALATAGISGVYFSDPQLTTQASARIDPVVAFSGQAGPANSIIPAGTGSARWTGWLLAPTTGVQRFYVRASGAVRLWIGDTLQPVLDAAVSQAEVTSDPIELRAGTLYQVRLEIRQMTEPRVAELRWSGSGTPKALVPATSLYPQSLIDAFTRSFTLLHKGALIVNGFRLGADDVGYLLDHAPDFANLDLQGLPLDRANAAQTDQRAVVLFQQWQRLRAVVALRNSLPPGAIRLIDVFGAAAFAAGLANTDPRKQAAVLDTREKLLRATGWDATMLDALTGTAGFNLPVDAYKNEIWLLRLQQALRVIDQLGIGAAQLFQWAATVPDAAQAQDIKRTVKARYDAETWLALAKSLNDRLRERQRDALVAYLLPRLGLDDSAQLFELFLIDVDMSSCMPTSRIKQAIASVQLFVQRCLMNLEPAVNPLAIDTTLWQWMKHYRTWEANRRVFLYPENWIEPELRDDKSPFFRELQTELLQTDLTPDAAETAFLHYLEKLDQVARLEICGMYWQLETDQAGHSVDVLHVFGRTFSTPQIYYYRQLRNRVVWTPWERVNLDISGDHIIPVIFNRRLYLFWAIFTQKVQTIVDLPQAGTQPTKYWEISLAWSEYKHGKWLAKQVSAGSKGFISTSRSLNYIVTAPEDLDRRQYVFKTLVDSGRQSVTIICKRARPDRVITDLNTGQVSELFADVGQFVLDSYGRITAQDTTRNGPNDNLRPSLVPPGSVAEAMALTRSTAGARLAISSTADPRPVRIFNSTAIPSYAVLPPSQFGWSNFTLQGPAPHNFQPFFYQDDRYTYFVMPEVAQEEVGLKVETRFTTHYHPYVWNFIRSLNSRGIPDLLGLASQRPNDKGFVFYNQYQPTYRVTLPYPEERVDFSYGGAYTLYNWELFFHAPMLIASRLSKNQQWEEAQKWFHYIFDPTNPDPSPTPADRTSAEWARERYWKIVPFQLYEWDQISSLLAALSYTGTDPEERAYKQQVVEQINQWMHDPFNPHRIARLRQVAYQKHVLMKYIDNLISWGDYLFRQYRPETIQEATQLYVLAAELLGPRPQRIPPRGTSEPETYHTLKNKLDSFSNALVELENQFPFSVASPSASNDGSSAMTTLNIGQTLYFGIPQNDKLLGYWDTVADRLFKIRHCMNIEGIVQQLPLFEPPIDPGLLVQAAAAGLNLSSALSDMHAPTPYYRFQYMLPRAQELCHDLKALGSALLTTLEKRDAESLALLRSTHEINLLNAARRIKEQQIEEARQTLEGLRRSRLVVQARYDYYSTIPERIDYENEQIEQLGVAQDYQIAAQVSDIAASIAFAIPDFDAGVSGPFGSPVAKLRYGGHNIGNALQTASRVLNFIASLHSHQATMASIQGGWKRRSDEWALQARVAQKELDQIDVQILAARIRETIAEQELRNHDLQIEQANAVDEFMRRKYTNQDLYDWMVAQITTIYFQTYQLAYDLAKRAEKAYRFERGVTASNFIQFGYWDNLRKGLLAGEQLSLALRQMDSAFLEQNRREYEITKQISLMLHDPMALIALKETGQCHVSLPEALFDVDYPGHYMRRIRSVSLTIPAVVGPYTSINATLTLLSNKTRISSQAQSEYREQDNDPRFVANFAAVQSITTSHGQNDSGMFELSFHDERYLPFEKAGAVSEWRIDLPRECNAFDFTTISDVIITLNYTAREGGEALRRKAWNAATLPVPSVQRAPVGLGPLPSQDNLVRLYSAKHEFPNAWYRFLSPQAAAPAQSLAFELTADRFPFQFRSREVHIQRVELFWKLKTDEATKAYREQGAPLTVALTAPAESPVAGQLTSVPSVLNGMPRAMLEVGDVGLGTWTLTVADGDIARIAALLRRSSTVSGVTRYHLNPDAIDDLLIVCHYALA